MPGNGPDPFRFRHLYLDTNIVIREGWPRISAKLENVLSLSQSVGVAVYLPDAVRRELESHWLRLFDEKRDKLQEHLEPLTKHLSHLAVGQVPPVIVPEREQVRAGYRDSVKDIDEKWGIGTIPIADLNVGQLLDLAIDRQVVFEDKGSNFQDALIYLSVLDHLKDEQPATRRAFLSNDAIFEKRKADLEGLAAGRGVELKVYTTLDQVAAELVSREQESERHRIEEEKEKALEALRRESAAIGAWLNANLEALRLLQVRYPARDHLLTLDRVLVAVPTFGHNKPGDRVRIAVEVEARIFGLIADASQSQLWGSTTYYATMSFEPPPRIVGRFPNDSWQQMGTGLIEIEAEATLTAETYVDFSFLTAQVKNMPPPIWTSVTATGDH